MIFAAGLGTRFKPWTEHHPKALAPIHGRSLLERNVRYLQSAEIFDVIVNVHHFAGQVEEAITRANGWGSRISISDERDQVLETGGGLKKAASFFDNTSFVVINADILTDLDLPAMIAAHDGRQALATLAVTGRSTSRYFLFNGEERLEGWRNEKTGETRVSENASGNLFPKAFSGVHVMSPEIFSLMPGQGKFSIVDTYLENAGQHPIFGFDHSGSRFIDVGKPEAVAAAEVMFA